MTKYERITKFLYDIKTGKRIMDVEELRDHDDFIDEIKEMGLVSVKGSFFNLTKEGIMLTNSGKTYEEYLNPPKQETPPYIHLGHNITGNVSHSDLSNKADRITKNRFLKKTTNKIYNINKSARSILEILSWIAGIIVAAITIYLFLKK